MCVCVMSFSNVLSVLVLLQRQMCVSKRETYATKIQELGALPPPSERESFANKSISDLMKSLESVNKKLKKYSHVNKKAYDQYVNFSEQRDSLLKRKDELDSGANKVKELVESLDRQKDEAINRTFRGVSAHFKDVFKELVPLGEGELVMRTAIDEPESDEEEEAEDPSSPEPQGKQKKGYDPNNPDVSLYRGVSVKVRFSPVGENFLMSQLSGGQKALVALALIFAIQRCDPAPFYIFDELVRFRSSVTCFCDLFEYWLTDFIVCLLAFCNNRIKLWIRRTVLPLPMSSRNKPAVPRTRHSSL